MFAMIHACALDDGSIWLVVFFAVKICAFNWSVVDLMCPLCCVENKEIPNPES